MQLRTKDGKLITATAEKVDGNALIESVSLNKKGKIEIEYEGTTDILWGTQITVKKKGQRVFIDEDGGEHLESEVVTSEE